MTSICIGLRLNTLVLAVTLHRRSMCLETYEISWSTVIRQSIQGVIINTFSCRSLLPPLDRHTGESVVLN